MPIKSEHHSSNIEKRFEDDFLNLTDKIPFNKGMFLNPYAAGGYFGQYQ